MPLFMFQASYTSQSWAAQIDAPLNRFDAVARPACEAVGGQLIGGWLSMGEYDFVIIAEVPNIEAMGAIAIAVAAGGAIKSSKTTALMTGEQGIGVLQRAGEVTRNYKPALTKGD